MEINFAALTQRVHVILAFCAFTLLIFNLNIFFTLLWFNLYSHNEHSVIFWKRHMKYFCECIKYYMCLVYS